MTNYTDRLPENIPGGIDAVMSVAVKTERGHTLTHEHGFTIEEESNQILAFDLLEHPELGVTLLFGNQVFALKFWDDEDLEKGIKMATRAMELELQRRKNEPTPASE